MRQLSVIKGDVNCLLNFGPHEKLEVPSRNKIEEIFRRLENSAIDSSEHHDALEFLHELFYINSSFNEEDFRNSKIFLEKNFLEICENFLFQYLKVGIFSSCSIRRSTQFLLFTIWNLTGVSVEFRLDLTRRTKFIEFLIEKFLKTLLEIQVEEKLCLIVENLIQSIVSIIHNVTLSVGFLDAERKYEFFKSLLVENDSSKISERFRLTLFLILTNLNPKRVVHHLQNFSNDVFSATLLSLFRFLKKIVQQQGFMIRIGLSAWILVNAINKLSTDFVVQDETRIHSLLVLFKRGMKEERAQAFISLDRCLRQHPKIKEVLEKDLHFWTNFQQTRASLDLQQTPN